MLEFDALPRRHMGIGRHRRTQGAMGRDIRPAVAAGPVPADPFQVATGRTPQFFVEAGLVPDDDVAHRLRRYKGGYSFVADKLRHYQIVHFVGLYARRSKTPNRSACGKSPFFPRSSLRGIQRRSFMRSRCMRRCCNEQGIDLQSRIRAG